MQRINVVGSPGSGKTTFSRALARRLGLPYVELDALFWKPDWREPTNDEFFPRVEKALAGERWVLDGNYSRTVPIKWKRVEQVIWLDTSLVRSAGRVTARTIRRGLTQEELWPGTGNRESLLQAFFSKKSIIRLAITTHRIMRERYSTFMASPDYAHISFVRLRTPGEARRFLESI